MAQANFASELERIIAQISVNSKKVLTAFAPAFYTAEDDLKYLEELVVQQDGRFRRYQGTPELKEYLTHIVQHSKSVLWYTKLADTLDRLGIFVGFEEVFEIPLKGVLYASQISHLLKDRRLNVPRSRLATMGAKYGLFEMASTFPFLGEIADWTNVYYKEFMKSMASGVSYNSFIQRNNASPLYARP